MLIIDAYRKDTGRKVRVPEHWIGHPTLGKNLSKTPTQKARERAVTAAKPTTTEPPASGDDQKE